MRILPGLIIGLVSLTANAMFYGLAVADLPPKPQESPQAAALAGLESLKEITREESFRKTYSAYGFDSPVDGEALGLGRGLPVYVVELDRLRHFEQGRDPEELLNRKYYGVVYPITVNGIIVTSMTVTLQKYQKWKATSWGGANFIRSLTQLNEYRNSQTSFIISVLGLQRYFVGDRVTGRLMLTPVGVKGDVTPLPAEAAFLKLVPAAQARDDKPG